MADIALTWDPVTGTADWSLTDGDLTSDNGLKSAAIVSLLTDARADAGDELPGDDDGVRGWWGDEFAEIPGDTIGSKLWLLERSKLGEGLASTVETYCREALQWSIDDGEVQHIDFEYEIKGEHFYFAVDLIQVKGSTRVDIVAEPAVVIAVVEPDPEPEDNAVFPAIAANLGAIMGEVPDNLWPAFGAMPIVDTVGGKNFTIQEGAPNFGVAMSGIWNGVDHTSVVALEMTTALDLISLSLGEDLNPGTDSWALLLAHDNPTAPASNRSIISTRQTGDLRGWSASMLVGSNRIYAQADQGASHVSAIVEGSAISAGYTLVVCNRTTGMLHVYTKLGSKSVSIAGHTTYTGAGQLTIGKAPNGSALVDMRAFYGAFWKGVKAENLAAAAGTAFWQPQIDNPPE